MIAITRKNQSLARQPQGAQKGTPMDRFKLSRRIAIGDSFSPPSLRLRITPGDPTDSKEVSRVKKGAVKLDCVAQKVIQATPSSKPSAWKSAEFMYFAGDVGGSVRLTASLANTILHRPDPSGLSGLGMTSALSVLTGYVGTKKGLAAYSQAEKVNDTTGQILGAIDVIQGPTEILGGLTFTPFRLLSIVGAYTATKSVAVATTVFATVGSGFFGLVYCFLILKSAIILKNDIEFRLKLNEVMDAPENKTEAEKYYAGLKFLLGCLRGSEEEWKKTVASVLENPFLKGVDPIASLDDEALLTRKELSFIKESVYAQESDPEIRKRLLGHANDACIKMKRRLEVDLTRKLGSEVVSRLKRAHGMDCLLELLRRGKGVGLAKKLFGIIDSENLKTRLLHTAIIGACALGIFAMVGGIFASGGGLAVAVAVAWVVSTIAMLGIDGYSLWEAYKSGSFDLKDKALFFAANALLLTAAGVAIVFSGGIAPLVIGGVVGSLWVVLAGYSYMKWNKEGSETNSTFDEERAPLLSSSASQPS